MAVRFTTDDNCVYCQSAPALPGEGDHVIARGFFPPRLQAEAMIVAPACRGCNLQKSKDEQAMLRALLLTRGIPDHPVAKELIEGNSGIIGAGSVGRDLLSRQGNRWLMHQLQKQVQFDVRSAGGVYLGTTPGPVLDHVTTNRLMYQIALGLVYHETGLYYTPDVPTFIRPGLSRELLNTEPFDEAYQQPARILGEGVFKYSIGRPRAERRLGSIVMSFYDVFHCYFSSG